MGGFEILDQIQRGENSDLSKIDLAQQNEPDADDEGFEFGPENALNQNETENIICAEDFDELNDQKLDALIKEKLEIHKKSMEMEISQEKEISIIKEVNESFSNTS